MEIPWRCRSCHSEQMVDFEKLESWPLDRLITAEGYQCKHCGTMEAVAYCTVSLQKQYINLLRYAPEHNKFSFLFARALRKAEGVFIRGETINGTSEHENLAATGQMG